MFEVYVIDCATGLYDMVKIKAASVSEAIDIAEAWEDHEYEVIEVERVNAWNV